MNDARDTTSTPPPPGPPPPGPPPRPSTPRLTRSTDDKVASGLCGGLGRHFGVDPVVFRIAFVVLALAGGSGLLLYLVGWIMVPDDRTGGTVLDRARHGHPSQVLAAVLIGIGVFVLFGLGIGVGGDNDGGVFPGLVLLGVGAAVLWSRRDGSDGGPRPVDPGPGAGVGTEPAPPAWAPPPPRPLSPPPPAGPASLDAAGTDVTAPLDLEGAPQSTTGDSQTAEAPLPPPPPAATDSRARRPPSALVAVTLSLLAILAGVLALLGASDSVDVPVVVALALPLLIVGGALCVGAWWGRARWLIPIGAVLGVGVMAAAVVDVPVGGGVGDRTYRPQAVSELRSPYRLGAGDLVVDLSALDLRTEAVGTPGQEVPAVARLTPEVEISLGAGDLEVVVPDGAEVVVDVHAGAGDVSVFGRDWDGFDVGRRLVEPGREGGGRLVVEARVGLGNLEVRRASS